MAAEELVEATVSALAQLEAPKVPEVVLQEPRVDPLTMEGQQELFAEVLVFALVEELALVGAGL